VKAALTGPRRVHAVDANPRQNAPLELKLAGIRHLDFDDFVAISSRRRGLLLTGSPHSQAARAA
jgi:hypothetical protein